MNVTNHAASTDAPTFASGNCRTCGRPKAAPYRRVLDGEVTEGCIAADHDAHPDAWHLRPRAVAHRADTAAHLARVLGHMTATPKRARKFRAALR